MKKLEYSIGSLLRNRQWLIFKDHITFKKLINIGLSTILWKTGIPRIYSFPYYIKVETTDRCNLKCPQCHDNTVSRKNKFLEFPIYKNLINDLKDYLIEVSLYDQGEPLIDPAIIDYIKYANNHNIGTVISTNLSIQLKQEKLIALLTSGLDYLIVAIDGVTKQVYEKYRIGGNLDLVLSNLEKIVKIKNDLNLKKPIIEWQMIDFDFNKPEQEKAKILARQIGVNRFILKTNCYSIHPPNTYIKSHRCPLLWFSFAVECDGLVSACFRKDDSSLYVGDLTKDSVIDIWNSPDFQRLRKLHSKHEKANNYLCRNCDRYRY